VSLEDVNPEFSTRDGSPSMSIMWEMRIGAVFPTFNGGENVGLPISEFQIRSMYIRNTGGEEQNDAEDFNEPSRRRNDGQSRGGKYGYRR
jgi:hypothetical protein